MKRGSIVVAADRSGEFTGKPRPALVISADSFRDTDTLAILPITSRDGDEAPLLRIRLKSDDVTGLSVPSWARIELLTTIRQRRVGRVIGEADATTMLAVNRALAVFLGIV